MRSPIRATHILSWVRIDSYFSQLIRMHSHMPNPELKWPWGSQKWVTPLISLISVRMEKVEGQNLLRFGATGEEIQKYWIPKNWGGDRAEGRAWSEPRLLPVGEKWQKPHTKGKRMRQPCSLPPYGLYKQCGVATLLLVPFSGCPIWYSDKPGYFLPC